MTIFAILLPAPNPALSEVIADVFGGDCLNINETQWLVSSTATVQEITARVGIYDPRNPDSPSNGNAIIFATTAYYGRAPVTVWDWIRAKLEAKRNG